MLALSTSHSAVIAKLLRFFAIQHHCRLICHGRVCFIFPPFFSLYLSLIRLLITKISYVSLSLRYGYLINFRENAIDLLQRYRRDRRILLDFILSGSLIKKVVMPPGAVTLDDVDLDQVSVDYVLNCAKKGERVQYFPLLSIGIFKLLLS